MLLRLLLLLGVLKREVTNRRRGGAEQRELLSCTLFWQVANNDPKAVGTHTVTLLNRGRLKATGFLALSCKNGASTCPPHRV